jgi:hypothetical protein
MKFLLSTLVAMFACGVQATYQMEPIVKANSKFGRNLLSHARRLDDTNTSAVVFNENWLAGFSIVFYGCHHISQWNDEADSEEDARIATKRLVQFRLCPSDSCSGSKGCSANYGDYIVDMGSYLYNWFAAKEEYQLFECNYLAQNVCKCANEDAYENFNYDECVWDCFASHNMAAVCSQTNPYGDDSSTTIDIQSYMSCVDSGLAVDTGSGRRNLQYSDDWDGKYYIGPYCASQGGAIFLGMFTDDSCSNFADSTGGQQSYYDMTTKELPYGNTNVVDMECLSCKEPSANNNLGDDSSDADEVSDVCEQMYSLAGKCEQTYSEGVIETQNNNACNYLQGIKIIRADGTVRFNRYRASKTATVFVAIFGVTFFFLSVYAYYLKSKLERATININE